MLGGYVLKKFGAWAPVIVWILLVLHLGTQPYLFPRYVQIVRRLADLVSRAPQKLPTIPDELPAQAERSARKARDIMLRVLLNVRIMEPVGHFSIYAVLGALLARSSHMTGIPSSSFAAIVLASGIGLVDEMRQAALPKRSAEVEDWLFDTAGAAFGVIVWSSVARRRKQRIN
jgi:VanZ family protein